MFTQVDYNPFGPELDPSPLQYPSVPIPLSSRLPPPSSTSSPSPVTAATFARKGGTREYGARGPAAAPRSLPSPQHPPSVRKEDTSAPSPLSAPPRSRGKGAHEGTSPRPLPAGARRTAHPPQSPSAQATPAQPHAPRPARIRERRDGAPTPPCGPRQPSRPHTQGGGSARPPPPHGLRQPGVYARRHAHALSGMQEGRCAQPSPLRAGCATPALPGYTRRAREEVCARGRAARTRRGCTGRGAIQPERERRAESHEGCAGEAERGATRVGEPRTNGRVGTSERGCKRGRVMARVS
ncbi:hypothetical protein EDB85DRAFT_1890825 [Lactarius pseudohatsudake]|nr:hypothetical protein EDB85DRAFT_1890825 [Lactarius pseudohatsudake]